MPTSGKLQIKQLSITKITIKSNSLSFAINTIVQCVLIRAAGGGRAKQKSVAFFQPTTQRIIHKFCDGGCNIIEVFATADVIILQKFLRRRI